MDNHYWLTDVEKGLNTNLNPKKSECGMGAFGEYQILVDILAFQILKLQKTKCPHLFHFCPM